MRTPDFMIGPEDNVAPELDDAHVLAAVFAEPVLIVLPRFTVTLVHRDGGLVAADAFEAAVRRSGARPVTDLTFPPVPAAGWTTAVDMAAGGVRVTGPANVGTIYDGDLDATAEWRQRVTGQREAGLVVVTGSAAPVPEAVMEMIENGRASWVRTTVHASRWRRRS